MLFICRMVNFHKPCTQWSPCRRQYILMYLHERNSVCYAPGYNTSFSDGSIWQTAHINLGHDMETNRRHTIIWSFNDTVYWVAYALPTLRVLIAYIIRGLTLGKYAYACLSYPKCTWHIQACTLPSLPNRSLPAKLSRGNSPWTHAAGVVIQSVSMAGSLWKCKW